MEEKDDSGRDSNIIINPLVPGELPDPSEWQCATSEESNCFNYSSGEHSSPFFVHRPPWWSEADGQWLRHKNVFSAQESVCRVINWRHWLVFVVFSKHSWVRKHDFMMDCSDSSQERKLHSPYCLVFRFYFKMKHKERSTIENKLNCVWNDGTSLFLSFIDLSAVSSSLGGRVRLCCFLGLLFLSQSMTRELLINSIKLIFMSNMRRRRRLLETEVNILLLHSFLPFRPFLRWNRDKMGSRRWLVYVSTFYTWWPIT